MKLLIFNICLLSALSASVYSSPLNAGYNGPVCGSLYGYTKTFKTYSDFNNDHINSGKLWSFLNAGPCTTASECKRFSPVCGVSKTNIYRTFVNICSMRADQKKSGIAWKLLSNGFCSKTSSSLDASPSSSAAQLLSAHPKATQKDGESSATVKRSSSYANTNSSVPSSFPLAKLAKTLLLLGNSSPGSASPYAPNPSSPSLPYKPSVPSSAPYQTIFNNAVYQGQFNYEPKRSRVNFGDFNFLPKDYDLKSLPQDSVFSSPTTDTGCAAGVQLKGPVAISNQVLKDGLENLKTISDLTDVDRFLAR